MDKPTAETKLANAAPAPQSAAGSAQILAALKEARLRLEEAERARSEPVAIVGTACRLPGGADTPEKFWDLLLRGQDAITAIPTDRWDHSRYYDPDPDAPGKTNVSGGGFIQVPREFDAEFFGIAPREALSLEPQQRLLLEVTWEALEDAGVPPARLYGHDVGVFSSVYWGDYGTRLLTRRPEEFDAYAGSGVATSMAAGRLAHILGLQGPALVVDTACSSSLVAVHLACQSLRSRECETALVGAASQILAPELYVNFTRARMLSPDSRCKTFDAGANGFVRSEGCVVVVLKRLSAALAAGDNVLAVILGSAVNHDGHSSGLTVPNGPAQQAVIRKALRNAGVDPAGVGLIEAHGTGTALGDPIEVGALGAVFGKAHSTAEPMLLGSVKSNIGHLEAAAGLAGLLKVVLSLRHARVPPNLHFKQPNPHIDWSGLPFAVPTQPTPWGSGGHRRVAGVSSFGFSGTNAHVVLAEAPASADRAGMVGPAATSARPPQHLLALSARSATSLRGLARCYAEFIAARPDLDIADICFSASVGRTHFLHRLAVVAGSSADVVAGLNEPGIILARIDRTTKSPAAPEIGHDVGNLEGVAALYLQGADIDWAALHAGRGRRRVPLPHYSFDRKPYWIDSTPSGPVSRPSGHPLLGERLSVATSATIYASRLNGAAASFLADHRIDGRVLMPATGLIEMALAAGRRRFAIEQPLALEDVVFHAPLVLPEEDSRTVQLVLEPEAAGASSFRVMAAAGDLDRVSEEEWTLCASGVVRSAAAFSEHPPAGHLGAFQTRALQTLPGAEHYAQLADRRLDFGSSFRGVQRIWLAGEEALAEIALPAGVDPRGFECHPALLDACLQVVGALAPAGTTAAVPMSLDRVTLDPRIPHRVFSHVRLAAPSRGSGDIRADITVFDVAGCRVAELVGLAMRPLSAQPAAAARIARCFYEVSWRRAPRSATARNSESGRWLIFDDERGHGAALAARLEAYGQKCTVLRNGAHGADTCKRDGEIDFYDRHGIRLLLERLSAEHETPLRGVVHLAALDADFTEGATTDELLAAQRTGCGTILPLAQALANLSAPLAGRLWVVTEGAQSAAGSRISSRGLAQSPVLGLGRVIARELPALGCTRIDLDPAADLLANAEVLTAELLSDDAENEVAIRNGGERYVPRLTRKPMPRTPAAGDGEVPATRLVNTTAGILDGLRLVPFERRKPGPHEVEIRIHGTGLGFRDVLGALGMYPGEPQPLGVECAGVVVAVGAGVTSCSVGDPVFGLASGCFGSHALAHEDCLARKPSRLTYLAAAAIPSSFLTAHYTLEVLGRLRSGQRVLIHAGAGGVGQAAVQIALAAGAEVFATAGSDTKRKWLRDHGVHHVFDSRSVDFVTEIRRLTGGRGVDYVLNSLAEPFISASIEVLADAGCFLEIGKRGILDAAEVARRKPQCRYFVVDLGELAQRDPAAVRAMLATLVSRLEAGQITAPTLEVFPLPRMVDAFRHMAQARHIGKIVIDNEVADSGARVVANATYLITGGMGGLGLTVAAHLADRGARHLILLGRSAPAGATLQRIAELERAGVKIMARQCDISRLPELAALLEEARDSYPPLRGIVHAAGVLDDGVVEQLSWDRFRTVFAPKVAGTWNLHTLTKHQPLDWLVLFASAAGVLGERGQGNYAAANAFLDSFALWRRANGLPALSIDWGAWSKAGMAARTVVARGFEARGGAALAPDEGVMALEQAVACDTPQVIVLPIDWKRFGEHSPHDAAMSLLREVLPRAGISVQHGAGVPDPAGAAGGIVAEFNSAPAGLRDKLLLRFVAQQIRKALGLGAEQAIDPQQPLQELGLDSLMAVELRNSIAAATGCSLAATFAFDYPVPEAIAAHLGTLLAARSGAGPQDSASVQARDRTSVTPFSIPAIRGANAPLDIATLTDDEAAELLLQELQAGRKHN